MVVKLISGEVYDFTISNIICDICGGELKLPPQTPLEAMVVEKLDNNQYRIELTEPANCIHCYAPIEHMRVTYNDN